MIMLLIACFCVVLSIMLYIEPVNNCSDSFWVIGDQKWVFGWKWGLKIVGFETAQMSIRSSEQTVAQASDTSSLPELVFDRSLKREPSER